jgi:hypothetical protein
MISTKTDKTKLKNAFDKIFQCFDPFEALNTNQFSVRAVIYPTDGYYLSELQLNALIKTLDEIDESQIFISEVETLPYDPFTKDGHWVLSDFNYEEYESISLPVENAIYSDSGRWGLLLSHEQHALMVADETFANIFQNYYQSLDKDLKEFKLYWDEIKLQGVEISWLPKLLHSFSIS